jgi:hypothetical protein
VISGSALFFLSVILVGCATSAPAGFDVRVGLGFQAGNADVDFFYDSLAPYGDWIEMNPYGWVWAPRSLTSDWRPYREGHWVYTDYGWTWVSYEDWGWAPYHYGRWALDRRYGWVWVPGSVWAPAWVSWRWGGGYAGWAPLPPEADVTVVRTSYGIDPLAYSFVEVRHLAEPRIVDLYVPPARNVTLVSVTENVTNYRVVDDRVVNSGVRVDEVERATGHAVPRARIAEVSTPTPTRVRGNEVAIYKPPVPRATGQPTRPSRVGALGAATRGQAVPAPAPGAAATAAPPNAAPAPARPAPRTPDVRELQQRHQDQQRSLAEQQARERDELRRVHEQEKTSPPPSVNRQELEARHKAEEQAQALHEEREKRLLADRQARERQPAEGQKVQHQEEKHPPRAPEPAKDEKHKKEKPQEH